MKSSLLSLALFLILPCGHFLYGQSEKTFQVEAKKGIQAQQLRATFPVGHTEFIGGLQGNLLHIYGKQQQENSNVYFTQEQQGATVQETLSLYAGNSDISSLENSNGKDSWKVQLNGAVSTDLDLSFGLGDAYLDFTGLKINQLNIKTGRAAVRVVYKDMALAPLKLFDAKIDAGVLHVDKLNLGNMEKFQAEIGFGELYLNFSDQFASNCHVLVNVGAGKLHVQLPSVAMPVQIKIDKSMLSSVVIPDGLIKVAEGLYATPAFSSGIDGAKLYLDINVSMGSVLFSF